MRHATLSERALLLAPRGRDAAIAAAMLAEVEIVSKGCDSLPELIGELSAGAAFVVVTEEALATADLAPLGVWLREQEEWSDLPFVLLTHQGGGLERNPSARRFLDVLGNVTFLERPFHPTTLVSLARSALRGRRRQYEARARLAALRWSEARLRFLSDLDEALRASRDASDAMGAAAELLARRLGASRCAYADVDVNERNDRFVIRNDYAAPGVASSAGTYSLDLFGPRTAAAMRGGRTLVVRHVAGELAPDEGRDMFRSIGIDAVVCCPLVKEGRLVAMMAVHQDRPRDWRDDEIGLVEAAVERCWAQVERVSAQARLRESEERFRNMADHAPVMMWVTEADGACTYLNRAWYEFTGQTEADALGAGWLDATHPDDRPNAERVFAQANAERRPFRLEYRLRHRDGGYRWAIDAAAPRFGLDGAFLGYVGSVIDIDERRAAEARLRTLTDTVPAFVWFATPDGQLHYFNDRWFEYTGQTPEEALPDGWVSTLHPDDVARTAAAWSKARAEGSSYEIEVRYRRRDGAYRWYLARAEAVRDAGGAVATWFGTSTDIHDRRLAEAELQRLNGLLTGEVEDRTRERDRIFEMSGDLFAVAGFDGYLKTINPAWSRLLGYSEDELLARPFVEIVHPDDRAAAADFVVRLGEGAPARPFEDRLVAAGGEVVWISWAAVAEGERFYAVGRDVTQDRLRDEALRQAQKMEAVGQLTGGVAHDFNNLLTIIRSSTDLLRRPNLADDRRRRYIDAISDTVDRASRLTGQLLAFARRQALKPEVFDTAKRIQAVADMLQTVVGSRVEIVTEVAPGPCLVRADASQFETALVNMVVNARDAMDGEGLLTIKVAAEGAIPPIRGHAGGSGPFVAVSVSDTGIGIPRDRIGQIFEPFFTTKEVGKGTGLGLSQVYGFAKQSGGDIDVWSEPGRGTTFTLYLPRTDEARVAEGPSDRRGSPATVDGHGRRVLVVEDNVEVGRFSTQLLQDLGYETTWAANGDEALQLLAEVDRFDAVFSDVVMPGMSGIDLGQEIRRRHPGLPVVLTSGYSNVLAEEGRHGFELLQKPYAAEELSRVLRRVTRHGRAARPVEAGRAAPGREAP